MDVRASVGAARTPRTSGGSNWSTRRASRGTFEFTVQRRAERCGWRLRRTVDQAGRGPAADYRRRASSMPGPLGYDGSAPGRPLHGGPQYASAGRRLRAASTRAARGQRTTSTKACTWTTSSSGSAERGEAVNNGIPSASSNFVTNPDGQPDATEGEYQLEIRRGPDVPARRLLRSFDTNDRMGTGQTLLVQRGLDIADGQTFTLSDGVRHVVFEYLDTTIPDNQPEPGRIRHPVHARRTGLRDRPARPRRDQRSRRPGGAGRDGGHRRRHADRRGQPDATAPAAGSTCSAR